MIQFKVWVFQIIPFLRDKNGPARRKLRNLRIKLETFGVCLLRIQSRVSIAFRDKPTAIIPYSEFEGDDFATQHHVDFLKDKEFLLAFHDVRTWMDSKTYRDAIWRPHICTWGGKSCFKFKG